jgi:hypothetical protein
MEVSGVVATDGTPDVVAHSIAEIPGGDVDDVHASYQAADLDGDGTDELVKVMEISKHGYTLVTASVLRVRGGALEQIDGPVVAYDDSAVEPGTASSCEGAVALQGRQIVITVKNRHGDPDSCLAVGRHAFELRAGKLVEI